MIRIKLKFISWFYSKYPGKYCWADCVSWAYSKRINPFKIESSNGCEIESKTHSSQACYCGQWVKGKYFPLLSKEDQEKLRIEVFGEPELSNDIIPF